MDGKEEKNVDSTFEKSLDKILPVETEDPEPKKPSEGEEADLEEKQGDDTTEDLQADEDEPGFDDEDIDPDEYIEDDNDFVDYDSDEDNDSDEEDNKNKEGSEPEPEQEKPSDKPVKQPQAAQPMNEEEEVAAELAKTLKPEEIPGTEDFFNSASTRAIELVKASLSEDEEFDEFDPKHQAKFNYHLSQTLNEKKNSFNKAVETTSRRVKGNSFKTRVENQINELLPTPELKKELSLTIRRKISPEMEDAIYTDLNNGDSTKLIAVAKRIAIASKKKPKKEPKKPTVNKSRKRSEQETVSLDASDWLSEI